MKSRSNTPRLFWPDRPKHGNVVLNFMGRPESEFNVYASAFWRAGRLLAKSLAGGGYRDMDACPIVFLYRHALELYMKSIVRRGKSLLSITGEKLIIPPRALERHELSPLLEPLRRVFTHVGWISKTNPEGRKMFRRRLYATSTGLTLVLIPSAIRSTRRTKVWFLITSVSTCWNSLSRSRERSGFSMAPLPGLKKNGINGHLKLILSKRTLSVVNGMLLGSVDINSSVPLNWR